jgi:[protein-PII] uridylyltransferase
VIETSAAGIALDRYRVIDDDFDGEVPGWRIDDVKRTLRSALSRQVEVPDLFQRHRRYGETTPGAEFRPSARVTTDVSTSERATIIDVFAHDRRGLLYTIARALGRLGLSVELAKISTHLDQVVDVFYVTSQEGEKIVDEDELGRIRRTVRESIDDFWSDGYRRLIRGDG